ncbi:hypothetical protein FAES_4057 [Fibrella aestuarina BUZ 2]|uniref:Uncharacterized protein n=1 Tax=Fibrella aestuarina BUZ 2 TaxID=1166018 RepID=I0KD54_9BACT|nr:hypothetical protein [Fibrella aestuarina]CCH02057.1 hypothetical protein FAES_4057 [Fibrella aestuarina BUZ 2]
MSEPLKPDAPAFPIADETPGLTKRELIAKDILAGLVVQAGLGRNHPELVREAISLTDELIKQLNE